MNWNKLKEKFPNSNLKIREFFNKDKTREGRFLIEAFLKTKGYNCKLGFIQDLKHYEANNRERRL